MTAARKDTKTLGVWGHKAPKGCRPGSLKFQEKLSILTLDVTLVF